MTWAVVLSANLWVVSVGVPLLLGGGAGRSPGWLYLLAALGPLVLGLGVWRRSEPSLLFGFPVATLLPQALLSSGDAPLLSPAPWPLLLLSLLASQLAVTWALAARDRAAEPPQAKPRPLPAELTPPRWRRRLRIYRGFTLVAALFPLILLAYTVESPGVLAGLQAHLTAAAPRAHALMVAAVGLAWLAVVRYSLLTPLGAHLGHDRDLAAFAEAARKQARRGRPRAKFYLFVAGALLAMGVTVWLRSR